MEIDERICSLQTIEINFDETKKSKEQVEKYIASQTTTPIVTEGESTINEM